MSPKTIKLCLDLSSVLTAALTSVAAFPWETGTQPFPADWRPWILKAGIGATMALRILSPLTNYLKAQLPAQPPEPPPEPKPLSLQTPPPMKLHPRTFVLIVALLATFPVGFFSACQTTTQTPQATMFATLKAAGVAIDSFRASYEDAFSLGKIDAAQRAKLDAQYNKANDAIAAALRAGAAGASTTPPDVDTAVRAFVALVTTIVPPKNHQP